MDKEAQKEKLEYVALVAGFILCSPFIALYYIVKWLYQLTPWQIWKWIKRNREIHRLEEALNFRFDPYYYKSPKRGTSYLDDLREKLRSNYKAPDMIVATLEEAGGIAAPSFDGSCYVLLLIHKDSYDMADYVKTGVQPILFSGDPWTAKAYFDSLHDMWRHSCDLVGRLSTLTECGNYEDYYVAFVPGEHQVFEVKTGTDEQLNEFIEDFKRRYKKQ